MSWRGSFVTNYIYCDSDFVFLKKYLEDRFPAVVTIGGDSCGVIAGHTRDSGMNDSLGEFDNEMREEIEGMIRDLLTIAVLTDDDYGAVFSFTPICPEYHAMVKASKEADERWKKKMKAEKEAMVEETKRRETPKEVTNEQYEKTLSEYDSTFLSEFFDKRDRGGLDQ